MPQGRFCLDYGTSTYYFSSLLTNTVTSNPEIILKKVNMMQYFYILRFFFVFPILPSFDFTILLIKLY